MRRYTGAEARALLDALETDDTMAKHQALVNLRLAASDLAATVEALEAERDGERDAVVADLRERAESCGDHSFVHRDALLAAASMIERGSHRVSR